VKRCETVVISKSLHDQRPDSTALMSGPRQGGHWVDGMAKKVGVRRWRHWHYADDFDHALIFTKRLETELFLVFAKKTEADSIFRGEWDQDVRAHPNFHCYHVVEQPQAGWTERSGRITADILRRHLPFSRSRDRPLPLRANTDDECPGRNNPRVQLFRRVCHPSINWPAGLAPERSTPTSSC